MERTRRLWIGLALLLTASFAVLLWSGWQISQNVAPMPERVVDQDGMDRSKLRFHWKWQKFPHTVSSV